MDELIIRSLMGETTAEEERQIMRWRAALPENDARYRALSATWELSGHAWVPPVTTPPSVREILARAAAEEDRPALRGAARSRPRRLPSLLRVGALAAALAGAVLVGSFFLTRTEPLSTGVQAMAAESAPETVRLYDGSVAHLAPGSTLEIDPAEPRSATLSGRAYFGIRHDPERPFIVRSTAGETRVLGTRFDLMARDRELTVVVVEGRVELVSDSGRAEVGAGEESRVVSGGRPVTAPTDVRAATDWLGNVFIFQATPLSSVATELEEEFQRRIIIDDPELRARTVTAVFTDRSLDQILPALCRAVDVQCVDDAGVVRVTRNPVP